MNSGKRCKSQKMNTQSETLPLFLGEEELYNSPSSVTSDDLWKKFEMLTPPLSPRHESDSDLDLENITMPFDIDTEDLLLFDDEITQEVLKEVQLTFPESPPDNDLNLKSNLIQDIMWSAPSKILDTNKSAADNCHRMRCNSCSNPAFNTACVAPDEVFPMETPAASNIGGVMSMTRVHSLGIETPSDSEEEIDVVNVPIAEKHLQSTVPTKRKLYRSDDEDSSSSSGSEHSYSPRTVTVSYEHRKGLIAQTVTKCNNVQTRVDCPTDVHNYSLPVTSVKRMHSYPSSPVTHKSKKLKRDICVPSDLRKVAQKLKSSVGSCSSRNSSDSEEICEVGKRTQHNVLERKRRTDLKNSFFHLRDSVPELEGQERAPKVVILRKASQYITRLIEEQKRQEREMEQLKIKKEKLRRHLAKLRDY